MRSRDRPCFLQLDRGRARQCNDSTLDSRATFFTSWLQNHGVNATLLGSLEKAQIEALIGAFVDHLLERGGITERSDLAMGTLAGYISAATTCLRFTYGLSHPFLLEGSLAKTAFVRALLEQRRT
jgi:hypothetical protein